MDWAAEYDRPVTTSLDPSTGSTRERLLDAAAEVFCERGYERTTVAEVARRAGLTTGAIYANFRDKGELLLQTIERDSALVVADMEAARSRGASATDRLVLMARQMVTRPDTTDRLLLVELFAAARRDPNVARRVTEMLGAIERELTRLMERAQHDGDVDDQWDAATMARFCLALGVGFSQVAVAGLPHPDAANWTALTAHMVAAVRPPK